MHSLSNCDSSLSSTCCESILFRRIGSFFGPGSGGAAGQRGIRRPEEEERGVRGFGGLWGWRMNQYRPVRGRSNRDDRDIAENYVVQVKKGNASKIWQQMNKRWETLGQWTDQDIERRKMGKLAEGTHIILIIFTTGDIIDLLMEN